MKKMKNIIFFLTLFIVCFSCQKLEKNIENKTEVQIFEKKISIQDLNRNKINELFVVLFKNNLDENQWKSIFIDTQKLSQNKRKLAEIEGLMDVDSESIRSKAIAENSVVLQRLTESSVFILSWSLNDENCKFIFKDTMNLICKPRNLDNPMNGGLPLQVGDLKFIQPDPIISDIKTDYLSITLAKDDQPSYVIELRLKLEATTEKEFWFRGDVIPQSTHFKENPFPFGYAELTTIRSN